jgi:hypothetical protein
MRREMFKKGGVGGRKNEMKNGNARKKFRKIRKN